MKKVFCFLLSLSSLHFTHAQSVGIGVSNPIRAKLEVNGVSPGGGSTSAIFGGESTGISLQRNWPTVGFNQYLSSGGGRYMGNGFAAIQYLDPNNGGLFIDLFPNGGVNTPTPLPKRAVSFLQSGNTVFGSTFTNASVTMSRNTGSEATACMAGTTYHSFFNYGTTEDTYIRAGKNNGNVFINDVPGGKVIMGSNAFVGINATTPGHTLEIRQHLGRGLALVDPGSLNYWEMVTGPGNSAKLVFLYRGTAKSYIDPEDGDYGTFSDRRLKTNIRQLPSVLDKVMQLQPVEYEMKETNPDHRKTIGFIAQDVKKLFPDMVRVIQDTTDRAMINDLHSLHYKDFGILAIKAVQEQQQLIASQEKSIQKLQSEIDNLKQTLEGIFGQPFKKE